MTHSPRHHPFSRQLQRISLIIIQDCSHTYLTLKNIYLSQVFVKRAAGGRMIWKWYS